LQLAKPELELFFKAFVVDHKARKESSEEALKVSGWLKNLGNLIFDLLLFMVYITLCCSLISLRRHRISNTAIDMAVRKRRHRSNCL
jgi:hypothetical protein